MNLTLLIEFCSIYIKSLKRRCSWEMDLTAVGWREGEFRGQLEKLRCEKPVLEIAKETSKRGRGEGERLESSQE